MYFLCDEQKDYRIQLSMGINVFDFVQDYEIRIQNLQEEVMRYFMMFSFVVIEEIIEEEEEGIFICLM